MNWSDSESENVFLSLEAGGNILLIFKIRGTFLLNVGNIYILMYKTKWE